MVFKLPSWSEKDLGIAEQYLEAKKMFDQNSGQQHHLAAHALGYKGGYAELPEGVRSAIKHLEDEEKRNNSPKVQRERREDALQEWRTNVLSDTRRSDLETDPEIVGDLAAQENSVFLRDGRRIPRSPLRPKSGGRRY